MIDSIENPNANIVLFKRRGEPVAQSWIRIVNKNIVILDSIEAKGEVVGSLAESIKAVLSELRKHYKFVVVGHTPNRHELNKMMNRLANFSQASMSAAIDAGTFALKSNIYSNLKVMYVYTGNVTPYTRNYFTLNSVSWLANNLKEKKEVSSICFRRESSKQNE